MRAKDPALGERLARAGCQDPRQAERNLRLIAGGDEAGSLLDAVLPRLLDALPDVPDPDMALNNLERYTGAALQRSFLLGLFRDSPKVLDLALTIFGSSQFLSDILVRHPQFFEWLLEPGVLRRPRLLEDLRAEAEAAVTPLPTADRKWRALRELKAREVLRIGLQDLLGNRDLTGVTEELSDLADAILDLALGICRAELLRRHGEPQVLGEDGMARPCPFVIMGMGKLGGRELNFSSDVDLMFVYGGQGETAGIPGPHGEPIGRISNHEFFRKLGEMLVKAIGEVTPEGHLFRVDLRLRPEGRAGDIATSLRTCEVYYEAWGQTWERQALIKARPVAGDPDLGRAFLQLITPFVYRQYLDHAAVDEIRAMKERINLSLPADRRGRRNVKLGYGGIREVEFIAQAFQLLHGGRNPWVREPNSLRALHRLADQRCLSYEDYSDLARAYTFLRTAEHRIQILHQLQTHTLPEEPRALRALAKRMGYSERQHQDPAGALLAAYEEHTRRVRRIYDSLLARPAEPARAQDPMALFFEADLAPSEVRESMAPIGFADPGRALRTLVALRDGPVLAHYGRESRRALARMAPALLDALREAADPDMALIGFERYIGAIGGRATFLEVLEANPAVLTLLVRLFGGSEFLSHVLIQRPELLEVLLEPDRLRLARPREALLAELRQQVAGVPPGSARLDALRRFKKSEELRIGIQDLVGGCPVAETSAALTRLAEVCLQVALELAGADLRPTYGEPDPPGFLVVGMGKLGGMELNYGSDLDVVYVYRGDGRTAAGQRAIAHAEYFSRLADRIGKTLTTITQEGAAYRVDTRLRPGGQKGEAAAPLEGYRKHFEGMAEAWERLAYVKARAVAGNAGLGGKFQGIVEAFVYGGGADAALRGEVDGLRRRMTAERAGNERAGPHVKLGAGGIADVEFIAQFLQIAHGRDHPRLRDPSTLRALEALAAEGLLSAEDAEALEDSYLFLRRVENRLRIVADLSLNTLPRAPAKLDQLGRRLGYAGPGEGERFAADYAGHTSRVRGIYGRIFDPAHPLLGAADSDGQA